MRPVVVALQGDAVDDAAVDHEAAELARKAGTSLVAVRVVQLADQRVPRQLGPLSYVGPHRLMPRGEDARLAAAARAGRAVGVDVQTELIASSDPAGAIADAARRHDASVILVEPPEAVRLARMRGRRLARRIRRLANTPVFTVGRAPNSISERIR